MNDPIVYKICEFQCHIDKNIPVVPRLRLLILTLVYTYEARMEEGRSAFKILTGKSTGKIPFGEA